MKNNGLQFNFSLNEFLLDEFTTLSCKLIDLKKDFDNSEGFESNFTSFDDYFVTICRLQLIVDLLSKNAEICLDILKNDLIFSRESPVSEEV